MKKVVIASLLAVCMMASARLTLAQDVTMQPDEAKAYNDAMAQTAPAAKAAALEAYLQKYPQSSVKTDTLLNLMLTYSAVPDATKTLDAADRVLQVDPTSFRALFFETYYRESAAAQLTDPAAKQTALDSAASYAPKGLAAPKPSGVSDDDFVKLKNLAYPVFYGAIATAALNKKDTATAIDNYKKELASVPVEQTTAPGPILQDTYALALAYYQSTPPDYLNCTFYATRVASYAPDAYKPQFQPLATYCYKKFHGATDGYDAVVASAKANLTMPSDLKVTPAKTNADLVTDLLASTPDLSTLALSDKEFVLQYGKPEDAEKVFATIKGKETALPPATVIEATDSSLKLAISDDAVQAKTADFTITMKEPIKTPPAAGTQVKVVATYDSYTQNPPMIVMTSGSLVPEKKAATPVKKPAAAAHKPH